MEQIVARFTGKSAELLSYDEVRKKLHAVEESGEELRNIPLDAIVGSVDRYTDFTRSFLPRYDSDIDRWIRVQVAVTEPTGLPPIEVYQIGEVYFVHDGNHRVSVARQLGADHIQAYVTEVHTKVPLLPDDQPDDLILKAEYAKFLEHTKIDRLLPEVSFILTVPGQYRRLEEHIQVHHYFMGLDQQRDVPFNEAVVHWYEEYYLPIVEIIRERGILREFPGRTETDLYLWISEHRAILAENFGQEIRPEIAAEDLAENVDSQTKSRFTKILDRIRSLITANKPRFRLRPELRRDRLLDNGDVGPLFADILVGVGGSDDQWNALGQALQVAKREGARINGLQVLPSEAALENEAAQSLRQTFKQRCAQEGIEGTLNFSVGDVSERLRQRSRFNDLVIVNLAYPPEPRPTSRLSSGFSKLVRNCPRPILAVPRVVSALNRGLLAYDGSPKADEALFVSAYLALRWKIPITVVVVDDEKIESGKTMHRVQSYFKHQGVHAHYVMEVGDVSDAILRTADEDHSELIIMGGYGAAPVKEVMIGSAVDQILRESRTPTLICN
ncbi:MAG: universal stress protein [Anaerolineales bacterium]|jgi:nucleotide-binding universal stress UspA family protein